MRCLATTRRTGHAADDGRPARHGRVVPGAAHVLDSWCTDRRGAASYGHACAGVVALAGNSRGHLPQRRGHHPLGGRHAAGAKRRVEPEPALHASWIRAHSAVASGSPAPREQRA